MISGIFPRAMQFGFCGLNSVYLMILFKNWNFNVKTLGLFGAMVVVEKGLLEVPNSVNEMV
jgi:hypothetical protein